MSFPLGFPESFGVRGALFADVGTAFGTNAKSVANGTGTCTGGASNCNVFNSKKLRAAVGGGLIWKSPFGPLRLDVAYALSKATRDETELVRFGIGTRF